MRKINKHDEERWRRNEKRYENMKDGVIDDSWIFWVALLIFSLFMLNLY
jgi:hypothetical protein